MGEWKYSLSEDERRRLDDGTMSELEKRAILRETNPHNERTGHFTGRCYRCGSNDLWDDNLHYGCNTCHAMLA